MIWTLIAILLAASIAVIDEHFVIRLAYKIPVLGSRIGWGLILISTGRASCNQSWNDLAQVLSGDTNPVLFWHRLGEMQNLKRLDSN